MKNSNPLAVLLLLVIGCASNQKPVAPQKASIETIVGNPFNLSTSGLAKVSEAYGKSSLVLEPKELAGWGLTLNLSERLFDDTKVDFDVRFNRETHHLWIRVFAETEPKENTPFPDLAGDKSVSLLRNQGRVFVHRELENADVWSILPVSVFEDGQDKSVGLVIVVSKGEFILNQPVLYEVNYRDSPIKDKMTSILTVVLQAVDPKNPKARRFTVE